jgi:hypothetical protein
MVIVNVRWDLLRDHMLSVGIVAVCSAVAWYVMSQTSTLQLMATIGIIVLAVAVYVGLRHPLWLFWGLAIVLGFIPFGYVPGVHVPLYLVFAAGAIAAAVIHPLEGAPLTRIEIAIGLLLFTSFISLVANQINLAGIMSFVQWSIGTSMVFVLLRLRPEQLAKFGRIFVYAATANSAFGISIVLFDSNQRFIRILKPFGYGEGVGLRSQTSLYAPGETAQSLRLGGTWVLPNTAGLAIVIALGLCIALFHGWLRVYLSAILLVALALTLSRSAILSLALGVIVVLIFHTMRERDRQILIGLIVVTSVVAMLIPAVRDRILSSFGETDAGSEARTRAFRDFPGLMSGHWWFGLGWGRPEFKDGQLGAQINPPSNAPLLTVYRGGIFTGLALTIVLIIACVLAYRLMQSNSLPYALFGGVTIGVCLVAAQLDKTIVDIIPITSTISMVLAFLVSLNRNPPEPRHAYLHSRDLATNLST